MAYVNSYTFDNLSRIGNDSSDMSQRNVQNLNAANYSLNNFFSTDCQMERPIQFATSQPNVFYKATWFALSAPNTSGGRSTTNFRKIGFRKNDLSC